MMPSNTSTNSAGMASEPLPSRSRVQLHFHDRAYEVKQLDEFAFEVESKDIIEHIQRESDTLPVWNSYLEIDTEKIPIQFKVRKFEGLTVRFSFFDMTIHAREQLNRLRSRLSSPSKDTLHSLTYDDLANGGLPKKTGSQSSKVSRIASPPAHRVGVQRVSLAKKLAALAMMVTVMGVIGTAVVYIVHSRSSIEVDNGVLVGNYVPVNAPLQSSILEWFVKPGDHVNKGDRIARLSSEPIGNELQLVEAKLRRAKSELLAFRGEADQLRATLQFAELKMTRDLGVAEAEIQRAQSSLQTAQSQLKRLEPLMSRGNVALAEYDEAKSLLATATAELVRQSALKESLNVAKQAVKSNVLVTAHSVSNPMSELATKIAIGEAVVRELEETQTLLLAATQPVEVVAPTGGEVHAIYRNIGETVKVADQLMAISIEGDTWATGTVNIQLAPDIRPGHPVEIAIPSLGIHTVGTVAGIGHRSVYGQGGYHAEFRSGPLEVPIRIALDLRDHSVPSGMRLQMSIRVRNHLKEFKTWFQQNVADNVRPYWQQWIESESTAEPNTSDRVTDIGLEDDVRKDTVKNLVQSPTTPTY